MYLIMKLGNQIIDRRFVSLKNTYEEGYIQNVIKEMIDKNETAIDQSEEQAVFVFDEVQGKEAAKKSPHLAFKTFLGILKGF